jgi:hypothetical protein
MVARLFCSAVVLRACDEFALIRSAEQAMGLVAAPMRGSGSVMVRRSWVPEFSSIAISLSSPASTSLHP